MADAIFDTRHGLRTRNLDRHRHDVPAKAERFGDTLDVGSSQYASDAKTSGHGRGRGQWLKLRLIGRKAGRARERARHCPKNQT